MKERLRTFMDELLKDVPKSRKVLELKEELIGNMEERYEDLMGQGYREEDAYQCALDSAGDVRELFREFTEPLDTAERKEEDFTVRRKRSLLNAVSVSLYIVGFAVWMIIVAIGYGVSSTGEVDVVYGLTGFIVMLIFTAVATGMRVYCSGLYGKYQKYEKKDDTIVEEFKEWKSGTDRSREMRKAIDSVIWLLATILYFVISFGTMAWYITWVIWLIAPCGRSGSKGGRYEKRKNRIDPAAGRHCLLSYRGPDLGNPGGTGRLRGKPAAELFPGAGRAHPGSGSLRDPGDPSGLRFRRSAIFPGRRQPDGADGNLFRGSQGGEFCPDPAG